MWDWNEDLGEMNYYPRKSKKEYPKQRVIPERAESGADPGHLRHSKRWWMQLEWHGQAGKEKPSYTWLCRELSGYQHWSLCHWICMSLNERKPSSDLHFKNITFCSVRRRDGKRRTPEYCSCEKVWRPRVEQEHYLQHMFPYLSCAALLCSLQLASRPPSFCTTMTISLAWHSVQKIMDNGNLMLAISHVQIHTWKTREVFQSHFSLKDEFEQHLFLQGAFLKLRSKNHFHHCFQYPYLGFVYGTKETAWLEEIVLDLWKGLTLRVWKPGKAFELGIMANRKELDS